MQIASLNSFPSLPGPNGGQFYAEYISDSSAVVGTFGNSDPVALWQNGTLNDLGFYANPMAINASGEIAGFNWGNASVQEQAFIWKDGAETILPGFSGSTSDWANGLNDLGIVVGQSRNSLGNDQAVIWQNGQISGLSFLPGGSTSSAQAINNKGQIIGSSNAADGKTHEVIWQNGTATDLGSLKTGDYVLADALNDSGLVVGYEQPNTYLPAYATGWTWQNGVMTALPGLQGYAWNYAEAVNEAGLVVGKAAKPNTDYSSSSYYVYHAVVWQDGRVTDLNSLLPVGSKWVLEDARSINDQGEIVGSATYDGTSTSFMLTLGDGATPQVLANVATALSVTLTVPTVIVDSAANIRANLDGLEGLAIAGVLAGITLTDNGVPNLNVSQSQFSNDDVTLAVISSAHSVTVEMSGTAAQFNVNLDYFAGATALRFSDQTLIVAQTPGVGAVTSGNVTELYSAIFAREPDVGGLAFYENYLKANPGTALLQFADWFLASPEYTAAHSYPQTAAGDQQFIVDSYQNLLHRTPSAAEIAYYQTNVMASGGSQAHAQMLVYLSASAEFLSDVQVTAAHPADAQHWLVLV